MATILGIDADTMRIAYCVLRSNLDGFTVDSVGTVDRRQMKRTKFPTRYLDSYSSDLRGVLYPVLDEPDGVVYLEDVFMGANRKTYGYLSQVQGEIRYEAEAIYGARGKIRLTLPRTWQSYVGNYFDIPFKKPLTTKDCSMMCAAKILGYLPGSTHEADAVCIAFFGHMEIKDAADKKKKEN